VLLCYGSATASESTSPELAFIRPTHQQLLTMLPVQVQLSLPPDFDVHTFAAKLNGTIDISKKFTLDRGIAHASLSLGDGVRPSLGSKNQVSAPNLIVVHIEDLLGRRYNATQHFFVNALSTGPSTTGTITVDQGGVLSIPDFGEVSFPPGSFASNRSVSLSVTSNAEVDATFQATSSIFAAEGRLPYELTVNAGPEQPLTDFVVTFAVPTGFRASIPATSEIRVFGENFWEDGTEAHDTFELFPPRFSPSSPSVSITLPRTLFSSGLTSDGTFLAVITLGTTPTGAAPVPSRGGDQIQGSNQEVPAPVRSLESEAPRANPRDGVFGQNKQSADLQSSTCKGATLSPPLENPPAVSSPFGPRACSIGASCNHYGTDYPVGVGTRVLAMAAGEIEAIADDTRTRNGKTIGWGQYVVVKHKDGSRSLYAHLQPGSAGLAVGQPVDPGVVIALSGESGGAVGHPHLHVEYAPNGRIYNDDSKVDPEPCIGGNVAGSVTVRDNGTAADDAFSVAINGFVVCQTSIGASNTCAVGNLRPGAATLTLTCVIAPDNVGTYEIALGQGLTFSDGTTIRSGTLPEGGSISFAIVVPSALALPQALAADVIAGGFRHDFRLEQNEPNPFKQPTVIRFDLPIATDYWLGIYDIAGRMIRQYKGVGRSGQASVVLGWHRRRRQSSAARPICLQSARKWIHRREEDAAG
jgi:murein DD-endopeptidase MepM/ murein hydrolase activator NlpD